MAGSIIRLPFPTAPDAALPAAPQAIDEEVIVLFDEFRDRLLRYVLSLGLSMHDGEDVTQEVFLSLFRHLRLGKSRANLQGWLFRVAHNLALKQRHATQRRQSRTELDGRLAESKIDPAANPEESLARNQRTNQLCQVVRALPEQDRWCLFLRAEGLRYREIADVLGMSLGSVANSLARSLARLARAGEQKRRCGL
jgi:RNA polymerase sigma-70 factor, ECF subfamily